MRVVDGHIEGYVEMQPDLIGNLAFQVCMVVWLQLCSIALVELWQWNISIAVQPRNPA